MGRAVDKARGILKDLVGGTIPLSSTLDGGGRYLTAELSGDYAGLLKLVTGPKIIYDPGHPPPIVSSCETHHQRRGSTKDHLIAS